MSGFESYPPTPPPLNAGGPGDASGGDPIPQRDLGAILDAAFKIYGANANKLFVIVAVVVVPLSLISHLLTGVVFAAHKTTVVGLNGTSTVHVDAQCRVPHRDRAGHGPHHDHHLRDPAGSAHPWRGAGDGRRRRGCGGQLQVGAAQVRLVLLVSFLTGILVVIGFILLIVPGVILLTRFTVAIPALVIEDHKGPSR